MRNPKMIDRRSILKASAAAVLYPTACSVAAEGFDRIRIGQIGTSHAHAAGKMDAVRKLSSLYDVVGIAEPIETQKALAKENAAYKDLKWMTEETLLSDQSVEAIVVELIWLM